jgi:hypothetical protein
MMINRIVAYAGVFLPFVIVAAEFFGARWRKGPEPRHRRLLPPGWVVLGCAFLVFVCAAWTITASEREKQDALDERRASIELQERRHREVVEKLVTLIVNGEQLVRRGEVEAALNQFRQAEGLAEIEVLEQRVTDLRELLASRSEAPPEPAQTGDRTPTPSAPPQALNPTVPERCQRYDGFSLCLKDVPIGPDRIYYVATVSLVVRQVDASKGPLSAFFPLAGVAQINVGAIARWTVESVDGVGRCNNSGVTNCLNAVDQFSRLREGSVIAIRLRKSKAEVNVEALAEAQSANVSGRILVRLGPHASIESFGFEDVPVSVQRGAPSGYK